MKTYTSIVNYVTQREHGGENLIVKKFFEAALVTKIAVPVERALIEYRVLDALKDFSPICSKISVPAVREFDRVSNVLYLEIVKGKTLNDAWESVPQQRFFELGQWIFFVEYYLTTIQEKLFDGLWEVQFQIAEILSALKGSVSSKKFNLYVEPTVSLGDVGLKNIIVDDCNTFFIDFEFAHIALPGRDLANLAVQLQCKARIFELCSGYRSAGGNLVFVQFWKDAFKAYYREKKW